jgi:hypothetical protein
MANLLVNVDVASMQCTQTALLNLSMLHLRDALKLPSATPSCAYSAYSNYVATPPFSPGQKLFAGCIYAMHCNYLAALCCSLTRCAYSAHYYFVAHVASVRCTATTLLRIENFDRQLTLIVASARCTHTDLVRDAVVAPIRRTHTTLQYFAPSSRVVNKFLNPLRQSP